jgi:AcrR family transcriptional regulator
MVRVLGGGAVVRRSGAWQWGRTAETRETLLTSAREVFCAKGFTEAGVADVVARAGSSVGSLYHHFGGKTELFMALWEQHQDASEEVATTAVAKARAEGVDDPVELFSVGTRAFLENSWRRADLVRLFMDGSGPPGFEMLRRTRGRKWVRQNAMLLGAGAGPVDRLGVAVLTTVIGEAGREVAVSASRKDANKIIDAALEMIRRLDPLTLS